MNLTVAIMVSINRCISFRGAKQGGGVGEVSTPPEFWMGGGGLNTCQPSLILRKKILGGGGFLPLN